MSDRDVLNQVTTLLNGWYYTEIRALADAAIEACCGRLVTEPSKEDLADVPRACRASYRASFVPYRDKATMERTQVQGPRGFLTEWVDQATDGHQYAIYTYQAQLVAATSSASIDDEGCGSSDSARACLMMRADVWEELEARSDEWEIEEEEDDNDEDLPPCIVSMKCACAGHARGNPASDPCDTSEKEDACCQSCGAGLVCECDYSVRGSP